MTGKGAYVWVFTFFLWSIEGNRDFLAGKYHRGGRQYFRRLWNVVKGRAVGPEREGGFDHLQAGTGRCQEKVVHHLVDVVEKQFHFVTRFHVQRDGVVLQTRFYGETKFRFRFKEAMGVEEREGEDDWSKEVGKDMADLNSRWEAVRGAFGSGGSSRR